MIRGMAKTPKCFLCFLDDDVHAQFRSQAQTGLARHEQVLRAYRDTFINELKDLCAVRECPQHGGEPEQFRWWVDELRKNTERLEVAEMFERLIVTYETWISGRLSQATATLDGLLKQFGFD